MSGWEGVGGMEGQFLILTYACISNMSLQLGLEPFQKFAVGVGLVVGGGQNVF